MAKHRIDYGNPATDTGRPTVLADMTDNERGALARVRCCRAYCDPAAEIGAVEHKPGCAYATDRWIGNVRAAIRREMLTA